MLEPTPSTPAVETPPAPTAPSTPAPTGATPAPPAQPPAQPAAPTEPTYALTLPDGSVLEASAVERFTAFAKDGKLAPETAQKALELAHQETAAYKTRQETEYKAKVTGWESEVKADKDLGGVNHPRTLARVKAVMDKYGNPQLLEALQTTGFGNYPALVRFVEQIGAAMEGDQVIPPTTPAGQEQDKYNRMFPSSAGL